MFPPIFAVCAASAAVKAAIGSNPVRFYPAGQAEEATARPYAVWQIIPGGEPENYLGNLPDIDRFPVQVDVYADTATSARNTAKAIRDAIEPHAHLTRWNGEDRDPDTKNYHYSFDVDWFVQR